MLTLIEPDDAAIRGEGWLWQGFNLVTAVLTTAADMSSAGYPQSSYPTAAINKHSWHMLGLPQVLQRCCPSCRCWCCCCAQQLLQQVQVTKVGGQAASDVTLIHLYVSLLRAMQPAVTAVPTKQERQRLSLQLLCVNTSVVLGQQLPPNSAPHAKPNMLREQCVFLHQSGLKTTTKLLPFLPVCKSGAAPEPRGGGAHCSSPCCRCPAAHPCAP